MGVKLAEWLKCMPSNQASAGSSPTGYNQIPSGKAMGNHPCEKFSQENYNGEDILHYPE